MTREELDAVHRIAALFYEAGRADGYEAARSEVLCLPPRAEKSHRPPVGLPPRHLYTELVMASVKRRRLARTPTWSAERLAKEMTAVGVPWTRDAVVNLETGRRKRLAAHELLALAYVLDVDSREACWCRTTCSAARSR